MSGRPFSTAHSSRVASSALLDRIAEYQAAARGVAVNAIVICESEHQARLYALARGLRHLWVPPATWLELRREAALCPFCADDDPHRCVTRLCGIEVHDVRSSDRLMIEGDPRAPRPQGVI